MSVEISVMSDRTLSEREPRPRRSRVARLRVGLDTCDGSMTMLAELDRRLQYGPGMRVQRLVEAGLLIATFFTGELWFAYGALGLMLMQVLSPRLAPVAMLVAAFVRPREEHYLGDLYFDLAGTR